MDSIAASSRTKSSELSPRELGLLSDVFPHCRMIFSTPLAEAAQRIASRFWESRPQSASDLATLSLGVFGSRELLRSVNVELLSGPPQPCDVPGWRVVRRSNSGVVLCAAVYDILVHDVRCQDVLLRRNGSRSQVRTDAFAEPFVLRASHLPGSPVDRSACAEFQVLCELVARLRSVRSPLCLQTITGQVRVYVTEPPCLSCIGAMLQFSKALPGVAMAVSIDGAMLRYGNRLAAHAATPTDETKGGSTIAHHQGRREDRMPSTQGSGSVGWDSLAVAELFMEDDG